MRATEYLVLVVFIGVFIYLVVAGASNLNRIYPENPINTSGLTENYDKIQSIQDKVNSSYQNFQKLGSEDTSWFQKIGAGIVAIPYAVINFPIIIVTAVTALGSFVTNGTGGFLPGVIILAILTFLTIEIVKQLMQFFQRSRA